MNRFLSGRSALLAARIAVTSALLVAIVHQLGGLGSLARSLLGLAPWALAGALAALTADRLLMTAKWLLLLPEHSGRLGLFAGTRIYCSALLYGLFLPATLGADALRVALCARRGLRTQGVLVSVLVERMLGGVALLALNLAAVAVLQARYDLSAELRTVSRVTAVALALGLGVASVALARPDLGLKLETRQGRWLHWPLLHKLRALHATWRAQLVPPRRLWAFLGCTLLEQLLPAVPIWLLLRGLGAAPDPVFVAAAMALAHLAARLPLSIGGVGVQEASLAYMLMLGGVPHTPALLTAVALRVLETLCCVPWWIAQMLSPQPRGTDRRPDRVERAPAEPLRATLGGPGAHR